MNKESTCQNYTMKKMQDGRISSDIRARRMDFKMVSKTKVLLGFKDVETSTKHQQPYSKLSGREYST